MNKNIEDVEFTIFDTETTGLDPRSGDRIVEIAAVKIRGKTRLAEFQSLVNPHRMISQAAFEVNRITQKMLEGAPDIEKVIPEFLDFIQGSCLCSYNAAFDLEFLNSELAPPAKEQLKEIVVVDILKMARRLLPRLERYSLWFVADKLGINTRQEHRALADVELTIETFNRLKEILKLKGICDFLNFSGLFGLSSRFLDNLNNQKLAQIQQALDLKVKLRIKYLSGSSGAVTEREVMPKEIKQEKNRAYLIGYCCLRNEERSFRTDGILHLEII